MYRDSGLCKGALSGILQYDTGCISGMYIGLHVWMRGGVSTASRTGRRLFMLICIVAAGFSSAGCTRYRPDRCSAAGRRLAHRVLTDGLTWVVDALNREGGRTLANGGTGLLISPWFSVYGWVVLPFIGAAILGGVGCLMDLFRLASTDPVPDHGGGGSPYAPSPCMGAAGPL